MIDISKLTYKVFLLCENGEQLNITDIAQDVTWEENEGELAQRFSVKLRNGLYQGKRISSIAKPNCQIIITAETEGSPQEVMRGKITEWNVSRTGSTDVVEVGGYDDLYDLQESQDNRYISEGVTTKAAILAIFSDWGVPVERYEGPTNKNAKTTFKNEYLSDIILELLDTAYKHGAKKCVIRAQKGKILIIPQCENDPVYVFDEEKNVETTKFKIDAGDVITVVKVVAAEDKEGRQKVEAIVKGKTEYGNRQRIYVRDKDDTLAMATAAAKEILDEDGEPSEAFSIKAPDVPFIRKGDRVMVNTRVYSGYALVLAIQHDASGKTMSMDLEKLGDMASDDADQSDSTKKEYKIGDIVNFAGGYHYYTSMDTKPRGGLRTAGKAWIQNINPNGKHKYALIGGAYKSDVDGSSTVYGWVDESTIS